MSDYTRAKNRVSGRIVTWYDGNCYRGDPRDKCYQVLAAAVVKQAYLDYVDGLAMHFIFDNQDKNEIARRDMDELERRAFKAAKQSRRIHERERQKEGATATPARRMTDKEYAEAWLARTYHSAITLSKQALRFLQSDRVQIFTNIDGEYLIKAADQMIEEYFDGKVKKYRPSQLRAVEFEDEQ